MNQDPKKSGQHSAAYPSISFAEFIADLLGWEKGVPKTTKPTSRDKATRGKTRANAKPKLIGKA